MELHEQVLEEFYNCLGQGNWFDLGHVPAVGHPGWFAPGELKVTDLVPGWVLRSSSGSPATLGVSSFSGLGKFCFALSSLSRKGTLLTKGF